MAPQRFMFVGYDIRCRNGRVRFSPVQKDWNLLESRMIGDIANDVLKIDQPYIANAIAARLDRYEGDPKEYGKV